MVHGRNDFRMRVEPGDSVMCSGAMAQFRLIITFIVTKNVLASTKGLSIKLQGRWQDIIRAHHNIGSSLKMPEEMWNQFTHYGFKKQVC